MDKLKKIGFLLKTTISYLKWTVYRQRAVRKPIHIVFCTVDHYEPGTGGISVEIEKQRVEELLSKYPCIASKHVDSAGNKPKRTWFFPPHYHRHYALKKLVSLCEQGYGEVELHLHHGKIKPDTSENLEKTLVQCIKEYSNFGIFGREEGQIKYGFIHGDWALDNSRNGMYCGVNDELTILNKTGCYADFTFPAMNEANPSMINSIYYAMDDPQKPKSYDRGVRVRKNMGEEGLMVIQGPLYPFWKKKKFYGLRFLGDVIDGTVPVDSRIIDSWVKTGICIEDVPDVVFVKTHTHGATDSESVLGSEMDFIFSYLEDKYNDGNDFILHYATAREMYNMICALKDGKPSNGIELYRDYKVDKPKYDSSPDIEGGTEKLIELVSKTYPV